MLKRTGVKISVAVLVIDGALPSAVLGLKDIFDICNAYCRDKEEASFCVSFVGLGDSISLSNIELKLEKISSQKNFDIIIVPPIISGHEIRVSTELNKWLVSAYHEKSSLCAACMGSFVLAQTGLLDFKRATTHWLLEQRFKESFPKVNLQGEKILIEDGNIITSGGVTAYIDLALYIIEKKLSQESANKCASLLLVDRGRESQRCYKDLSSMILVEDFELKKLLQWMKDNLDKDLSIKVLAKKMKMQERSFVRRFAKEIKTSPNQYLQNLRIERAKAFLINSALSFEQITYKVGFTNESSFRRLFKRETSLNPGEYRKKFKFKA
ncbi:MAG: hypothetical protein COA44_01120 [Arcobacter sp.]|nr:MAG: hypothetical protein COA44_01120 [Arcobacter sp.]